jgi:hypothetical protein
MYLLSDLMAAIKNRYTDNKKNFNKVWICPYEPKNNQKEKMIIKININCFLLKVIFRLK